MADRNSRADDLFEILNEFNDNPEEGKVAPETPEAEDGSRVDEILEILNAGRPARIYEEAEPETVQPEPIPTEEEEAAVPASLFDHLSDEGDVSAQSGQSADSDVHFTDHFSAPKEIDAMETVGEESEEDDDDEYEEVSKVKTVGRFFKGMSFIPKAIIYIALVLIVSAYLSYYIITIGNDVFALVTDSREITVTINENATDEEVADILEENGVIEYGWVYELYMQYRGDGEKTEYIAGEHTLNTDYNYSQIILALTSTYTEREVVRVTIPEGYTVDQTIDLLVKNGIGQRQDYIYAINEYPYKWEFVQQLEELGYSDDRVYRLEGYLYPDTYEFYTDTEEVYVINKMLNAFYDKFWKDFTDTDADGNSYQKTMLDEYGMTFDDVIVLASMVQSEGGTAVDFYGVSYVFHNRLSHPDSFPKLESDATIQYALPERISDSSLLDTSYETPYNTYLYDGLPPGAICNPGLDALSATLFPEAPVDDDEDEIDAYFFVSNNAGKTYYAATKSGHEKNIERMKADNEAIKNGTYEG